MFFDEPRYGLTKPELPKVKRLVPFERHVSAMRWQFIRGLVVGTLVSSAIALPVFNYSKMRQHESPFRQGSGQTALGNSDSQAASGAQRSASEAPRTSFATPVLPKPQSSKPSNHLSGNAMQPAVTSNPAKSPAPLAATQPKPLTDLSFSEPRPTKRTLATLAQLWASFEAGNTKAAVALADLYLRGDGVPVNCEQARVLLYVASKENDAEATKKLQELDETGCSAP
jgi:hypothetical protein